jgi:CheY-like chemotaxis protein
MDSYQGKTALVVDDFPSMRLILKENLVRLGFKVLEAEHGLEGIERLEKYQVDIIFSDIVMPQMDGFDFCDSVRKRPQWFHIPIVVMSTLSDSKYTFKALKNGADDFIAKPIAPQLLSKVIQRLFDNGWSEIFQD